MKRVTYYPDEERRAFLQRELDCIIQRASELAAIESIYVYGSFTTGRVGEDSDLDLFVVAESSLPFVKRLGEFYDLLCPEVATDLIFYTPEEFESGRHSPFVQSVLREGMKVYGK